MRQTRKVVKDPIQKGQNRGHVEDLRADKMAEIDRYRRDNGSGQIRSVVQGLAQYDYRCTVCHATNPGPKQPCFAIRLPCQSCGLVTEQEHT
jgi:hypothetical protein